MHIIILCGGSGSRMKNYSYPKPLNMIYGKPALHYTTNNLPKSFHTIHFIYSKHLIEYNFETVVINTLKDRNCKFYCIDYFTRGPVESALIGIDKIDIPDDEPILFLDNDNSYSFPDNWESLSLSTAFLGCVKDTSGSESFSFVKHVGDKITAIREKIRISDTYCIGVYGFASVSQFKDLAKEEIYNNTGGECYMSSIFNSMITKCIPVQYIEFPNSSFHLGTLDEVQNNLQCLKMPKMRVCFDLDNTLVTYPRTPGDYSTVEPISRMIQLVRKLKNEGHTVIIYTARRMETHKYNVGAVLRDIGKLTFDTLDKFEIPYDEIIFGKPIADFYIDDRAINPYRQDMKSMGLFQYQEDNDILNMCRANKHNSLQLNAKNEVIKSGPKKLLEGQLYYYQNIPKEGRVIELFPNLIKYTDNSSEIQLHLEYLRGIPLSYLLEHELLTTRHIDKLLEILDILHVTQITHDTIPSKVDIITNYKDKLIDRMSVQEDYPYEDKDEVLQKVLDKLDIYLQSDNCKIVNMIHGDFWLSNILLLFDGSIKVLDMRGKVGNKFTLGGDVLYDYAKLYQSLLGYDSIVYEKSYNQSYKHELLSYYHNCIENLDISLEDLNTVTVVLMLGTFFAISSDDIKCKLWAWIKQYI